MILNLLHRPERPEHDHLFRWQQRVAHDLGLKVTVMLDFANLSRTELIETIKADQRDFGDELGFWFSGAGRVIADDHNGGLEPFLWLYPREEKERILRGCLDKFREVFGAYPVTVGSYHMDAVCLELLKDISPETRVTIAGCFEEGVRVFHGCNHSWYLFNEGMPWNPWYPSKGHSLRPAASSEDAVDIVAVPHLIRDLALSYEGRNDFFASHPQNIQRAMANDGANHPYDFNLLLQHQLQEDFNDGYSWVHVFVGPNWLSQNHNIEDSDEITQGIYRDYLEHFARMRDQNELTDMYMAEFGAWFKQHRAIGQPQVALGKDVLYGSGKHYFWYVDGEMRVTVDATQGGSIGDLRPYAARFSASTGPDSRQLAMGSYPYLIQSQHRTGYPNHSRDGSRTTAVIRYGEERIDLCTCPTRVSSITRDETGTTLQLSAAKLEFSMLSAELETTYRFGKDGRIHISRRIVNATQPEARFSILEYVKASYGFTEYPEPMHGITLELHGEESQTLEFAYRARSRKVRHAHSATARVPQIGAGLKLEAVSSAIAGEIVEGFVFNPFYTLTLEFAAGVNEEVRSCLSVFQN